jgi:hypothetical protein
MPRLLFNGLIFKGLITVFAILATVAGLAAGPAGVVSPVEAQSDLAPTGPVGSPSAAAWTLAANPLLAAGLRDMSATRERPLFSPSRRPPPEPSASAEPAPTPAAPAKPVEPERPQLSLIGTVTGDNDAFGVFLDQATNQAIKLRRGQDHDGWILSDVRRRDVVLRKDNDTAVLALPVRAEITTPPTVTADTFQAEQTRRRER